MFIKIIQQFFYSMKKKQQLLQIIKKDNIFHLTDYLNPLDMINLCVANKKYYMVLFPFISNLKLDYQQINKPSKLKNHKNKNKKKEQIANVQKQTQVYIEKMSLSKFSKGFLKGQLKNWKKIEKLEFYNEYLNKKFQNNTVVFYHNIQTNQIIYINRSMVDPNLNYNKGGFGEDFINNLYEHIYNEGTLTQYDLASQENLLKRQKEILNKINIKKEEQIKNSQISYEDELMKAVKMKKIGIILCFGGSFSFGIYEGGRCLIHKSDKKYVVRQKAGQRQFNKDKNSGSSIQSIGSQIRRDQQKKHVINVGQILKQHHNDLSQCQIIFLQAPGLNRLFVINENENLDGLQERLRSVCITAKKANFTQIQSVYQAISQINVVNIGSRQDFKDKNSKKPKNK